MEIAYIICLLVCYVLLLFSLLRVIYRTFWKKPSTSVKIGMDGIAKVNLFNIMARVKRYASINVNLLLIAMAERGFVKVRDNDEGIYIDKSVDFESVEPRSRKILADFFAGATKSYADVNSIMPVTSSMWKESKEVFKSGADGIIRDLILDFDKEDTDKPAGNKIPSMIKNLILMWTVGLVPIVIAATQGEDNFDIFGAIGLVCIATWIFCLLFAFIYWLTGKVADRGIKAYRVFGRDNEKGSSVISLVFWVVFDIVLGLVLLFLSFIIFMLLFASVFDSYYLRPSLMYIGILMISSVIILILDFINGRRNNAASEIVHNITLDVQMDRVNLKALKPAERSNLLLIAMMIGRQDIVNALDPVGGQAPEWYIGDKWSNVRGLVGRMEENWEN